MVERRITAIVLTLAACGAEPQPADLPHPAPPPAGGQVCSADGLCWFSPLPSGTSVRALWGSGWNDLWAGGDALLHFDGAAWSMAAAPLQAGELVRALGGTSARDVWAGGDRLLHFDGAGWSEVAGLPAGEVVALAPSPAGVLLVLDSGDGPDERMSVLEGRSGAFTTLVQPGLPDLRSLWVAPGGSGEAWVVGFDVAARRARSLHRSSAAAPFAEVDTPGEAPLQAVWGSGPRGVWAAGGGLLLHWDGARWSPVGAIAASAGLDALWGSGPDDVYAMGRGGGYHFDGKAWLALLPPRTGDARLVRAVWGSGARNVWAAGEAGLLWQGDRAAFAESSAALPFLEAVWASGPRDAWAAGGFGALLHWDGAAWAQVASPASVPLEALWGSGPRDVWAAGASGPCDGVLLHFDGGGWTKAPGDFSSRCLTSLHGSGPSDVWAAASNGGLLHFQGAAWAPEGPADAALSVYAAGPGQVFALQASPAGGTAPGGVYQLAGGSWTLASTGATATLRALWGSSARDVWAVGDDASAAFHWDGSRWSAVPTGADPAVGLGAVWGAGPGEVWMASRAAPLLLRWDGRTLAPLAAAAGLRSLSGLGGSGPGDLWAVGGDGAILHRAGPR